MSNFSESRKSESALNEPGDRISADDAWPLLQCFNGHSAFNHARRALQQVYDRTTKMVRPYPDFAQRAGWIRDPAARRRTRDTLALCGDPEATSARHAHFDKAQRLAAAETRRLEVEHDQANILVVPEWGGTKYPMGSWTYSRRRCQELGERGPDVLVP